MYTETIQKVKGVADMTDKRNLAPEEGPNGIDRWTSNGYGMRLGGKKVVPIGAEEETKDEIDEIDEVE